MEYPNYEQFFRSEGDAHVVVHGSYSNCYVSVEELYQHFKARLLTEMAGQAGKEGGHG